MILDTLARGAAYAALHPHFAKAFEFLCRGDLATLADGRYELEGDQLFVLVMTADGRGQQGAKLEVHRRYIDIQVVLTGEDTMGWSPLAGCRDSLGFDEAKDVGFFGGSPEAWLRVGPGRFAVFWPEDVHAPLAGTGSVRKAVVKVVV